ncbi:type II toxin-antitoxin system RelE/ParE family toxin [Flavobacterium restrictum]|uniref:Type II toxin-antitoxin system RelE/ParE family toxin n=1 Tax=Flavobacterium restrictum TaxID=2594428 RepID=A0A553E526_9FLAO|nr:type II toxin-antitoxin system RelE/ParE family toxin [Flavobacterium restrictum]TRX40062.1 type II toxin-antitoxin system RelE/ParE family toxin [Flavobacterium restrictum]
MKLVEWSEDSIFSLQSIYDYIFIESPQNANFVVDTLLDLGEKLNVFPEKNPKEPLYNSEKIRFFPKWNYKIIYSIEENRIYILDVFSTLQHYRRIKI